MGHVWCNKCDSWECVCKKKRDFSALKKTCAGCKRELSSRKFIYDQATPDRLRVRCRTCEQYIPRGNPSPEQIASIEAILEEIYQDGLKVYDPRLQRSSFELFVYRTMKSHGLLDTWKLPVWVHPSSISILEEEL